MHRIYTLHLLPTHAQVQATPTTEGSPYPAGIGMLIDYSYLYLYLYLSCSLSPSVCSASVFYEQWGGV